MKLQKIAADWNCPVVVAATGPSLGQLVAHKCRMARLQSGFRVIAVNDAYRLMPWADILYACDAGWWKVHNGAPGLTHGERWTTHEGDKPDESNYKGDLPPEWRINLVRGRNGDTFSTNPAMIHYGGNSGFQAVNLAILKGATRIVLVGFDMRVIGDKRHFFGDHPNGLFNRTDYQVFAKSFETAAPTCPVPVVNATPGSALKCWPMVDLESALQSVTNGHMMDRQAVATGRGVTETSIRAALETVRPFSLERNAADFRWPHGLPDRDRPLAATEPD